MSVTYQPTFPDLDDAPAIGSPSELEEAARASIRALDAAGLLKPRHALTVHLILSLARSLGAEMQRGKITVAMSQATKQLLDAWATLPEPIDTSTEWDTFVEALMNAK